MESKKHNNTATMKDVASAAGVSTATVSRTLMNPEKVSLQTRQKVEQAVLDVGYYPHNLARSYKRNESKTILAIVPDISDPFFSDVICGIEEIAAHEGYFVLIGDCKHQQKQENAFINLIITKQIDGMVLLGSNLPFDVSTEEQKNLPPIVMANEFAPELKLPTVHIDNLTASFNATHYLLKQGHKRIACIAGPEEMPHSQYRLEGYKKAMLRTGEGLRENYIVRGDFSHESGAEALKTLLSLPEPPTAVFCHTDIMAFGAMWQAKKMGLKIPEDISFIGFDNLEQAKYTLPALTTINHPRREIGRHAMLLLLEQLQGNSVTPGSRLLDSDLIVRESTKAPKC
ncbi:TPA: DNA-binding transcriptional regulator CytR [Providencia alcalifaciens]|uniref:DNA-binding transcriptional regulator CytR n=3 Tax=Providencia alcalifaciens TaxID=126385 RepID=A0AAW9VA10_9GAMM|nr:MULTISPECIES: DNA-binding transcriptional regulator CytR [Providencia]ATG15730.1 DNA-binding transcriptional regulator CytR [Providencia alcalifaciens]EKT63082.1 DNA-binding transcriptional regulator CytR [Providencia alcalifaciens Dmel2]EUD04742.1 periplasmic-binding protein-like domain protein [Providencia alcalifaciens RIMD 1656011]EUD06999.1 periplasmic-binding protein-like domain protein [Providencia alcalifaciens R90-1475]EUD10661.1 periplasmic-binding protein-like domain protein [Pro